MVSEAGTLPSRPSAAPAHTSCASGWLGPPPSLVDPADQPRQDGDAPSQTDAEARRALREAALATAQAAEQEAADASNERDAAAEGVRVALVRAVKARADAAVAVDRTLVLNVLCGLNERYKDIGVHLRRGRPFPSFAAVRNELLLEEINMVQHPVAPSTALVATGSSRQPAATGGGPPRTGGGAPKPKNKKKKDRRAGSDSAPGPSAPPAPSSAPGAPAGSDATWPSVYNPWTGSIQMWPGPRTPPLAPLPQGHAGPQQQAL
jgi:hypothetical protein